MRYLRKEVLNMGLDQSAFRRDKEAESMTEGEILETWRKHPRLQGFMNDLFIERTGGHEPTDERMGNPGMNTPDELELTLTDIDKLEKYIKTRTLPEAGGFFWGDDSSDHYYEQDLEFCKKARKAIEEGDKIIYWCWW
jgi:hypothetical protein